MGGGRKGIERHHDLPTGGSGALPEVAAVLADAALIGEAAPPPRLDALVCRRPTTSSLASSSSEPAPAEVEEVVGLGLLSSAASGCSRHGASATGLRAGSTRTARASPMFQQGSLTSPPAHAHPPPSRTAVEGFGNRNRRDSLLEGAGGEGEVCPDEEGVGVRVVGWFGRGLLGWMVAQQRDRSSYSFSQKKNSP